MTDFIKTMRERLRCGNSHCQCHRANGNVHCPSHEDKNPSLSIDRNPQSNTPLVCCHAGCASDQVIEELKQRDLWPAREMTPDYAKQPAAPKAKIVAIYDYHDETGTLLFQAVRYEAMGDKPKTFKQRRPDGAGGWVWNLSGVRRVLYRLPELIAAVQQGKTVFVVEGEKDVESLHALGFAATCNPQGAGKWREEYSECLRGANVVILPDNDNAGRNHAAQVGQSLQEEKPPLCVCFRFRACRTKATFLTGCNRAARQKNCGRWQRPRPCGNRQGNSLWNCPQKKQVKKAPRTSRRRQPLHSGLSLSRSRRNAFETNAATALPA